MDLQKNIGAAVNINANVKTLKANCLKKNDEKNKIVALTVFKLKLFNFGKRASVLPGLHLMIQQTVHSYRNIFNENFIKCALNVVFLSNISEHKGRTHVNSVYIRDKSPKYIRQM